MMALILKMFITLKFSFSLIFLTPFPPPYKHTFFSVEEAEQQRLALTEKYDSQVKALRLELAQLRGQLEAEKQAVAAVLQEGGELARQEDSRNAESRSEEVVQNLRREMEVLYCFILIWQNLTS